MKIFTEITITNRVIVTARSDFCYIGLLHIGFMAYQVFACQVFVHDGSGFGISGY
jgi:hypothetical protein